MSFKNGRPDRANYRRFKIKSVGGQDDFASMAEVVRRRYSRLLCEAKIEGSESRLQAARVNAELQTSNLPDLILIDGGKGQLNVACAELKKLGLEKIPVTSGWRRNLRKFICRTRANRCGPASIIRR